MPDGNMRSSPAGRPLYSYQSCSSAARLSGNTFARGKIQLAFFEYHGVIPADRPFIRIGGSHWTGRHAPAHRLPDFIDTGGMIRRKYQLLSNRDPLCQSAGIAGNQQGKRQAETRASHEIPGNQCYSSPARSLAAAAQLWTTLKYPATALLPTSNGLASPACRLAAAWALK
jgi:hypothetical protein